MTTTVSPSRTKIGRETAAGCVAGHEVKTIKLLINSKSRVYEELVTNKPPLQSYKIRVIKNFTCRKVDESHQNDGCRRYPEIIVDM